MTDSATPPDADDGFVATSASEFQSNKRQSKICDWSLPDNASINFVRARFYELVLELSRSPFPIRHGDE
jgi:hypothetical protein